MSDTFPVDIDTKVLAEAVKLYGGSVLANGYYERCKRRQELLESIAITAIAQYAHKHGIELEGG